MDEPVGMTPNPPADLIPIPLVRLPMEARLQILKRLANTFLRVGNVLLVTGTQLQRLPLDDLSTRFVETEGLLRDLAELLTLERRGFRP